MISQVKQIEELVKELPPHLQDEVRDFADFLVRRRQKGGRVFLRQDWGGALKRYRDQFTSQELQRKSLEWRED